RRHGPAVHPSEAGGRAERGHRPRRPARAGARRRPPPVRRRRDPLRGQRRPRPPAVRGGALVSGPASRVLPFARLPLTYAECRARFRRAATEAGVAVTAHLLDAPGPDGEPLTVDVAAVGPPDADGLLVVL